MQTLRYTDEPIKEYNEGSFEYNVLSKEILAFDAKDVFKYPPIETPTGADVVDNAFFENEDRIFEIPLGSFYARTYLTLLEQTPGTFRLPIQHQYEEFSADKPFFFGDDKRSFVVSPANVPLTLSSDAPLEADSPLLGHYLNSDTPVLALMMFLSRTIPA